nr:uncharacterized protein LOC129483043 [Symphalangus syndactylus]
MIQSPPSFNTWGLQFQPPSKVVAHSGRSPRGRAPFPYLEQLHLEVGLISIPGAAACPRAEATACSQGAVRRSPQVPMGFLQVLQFPLTSQVHTSASWHVYMGLV